MSTLWTAVEDYPKGHHWMHCSPGLFNAEARDLDTIQTG